MPAGHSTNSLSVEVLHDLWSCLCAIITSTKLATVVLTPAVDLAGLCESHTEAITNRHLNCLSLNLLDAMWGEKLSKRTRAPEK